MEFYPREAILGGNKLACMEARIWGSSPDSGKKFSLEILIVEYVLITFHPVKQNSFKWHITINQKL